MVSIHLRGKKRHLSTNASVINYPINTDTVLFIFNGESNSGGYASNGDPTAYELSARSSIQILNNTTLAFQDLDIGTNNLIGHNGLTANATHGWEIGLANAIEAGIITNKSQVHLVKTGQGGSYIKAWSQLTTYPFYFTQRVDAAISALNTAGKTYQIVVFFSLGINDNGQVITDTEWRTEVETWFAAIRTRYGANVSFVMTKFFGAFTKFDDQMDAIAAADSKVKTVVTTGEPLVPIGQDGFGDRHWNYAAMKDICNSMLYQWKTYLRT